MAVLAAFFWVPIPLVYSGVELNFSALLDKAQLLLNACWSAQGRQRFAHHLNTVTFEKVTVFVDLQFGALVSPQAQVSRPD